MTLYFIGYAIEGDVAEYYERIATDLSERFSIENLSKRSPAHATLRAPFKLSDPGVSIEALQQILENEQSIPARISGFASFGTHSRYLDIRVPEEAQARADTLVESLTDFGESLGSLPLPLHMHVSVARRLTPETHAAIAAYTDTLPKPEFSLTLGAIALYRKDSGSEPWRVDRTFELRA